MDWKDEELLKRYAPALAGNDYSFQSDLYNTNADVGAYPAIKLDAPMRQTADQSPWASLNSVADFDAVAKQMDAERQQQAATAVATQPEEKKPSMWAKVGKFFKEALPVALMVSGAGFAPKLAIGAAMKSYNDAKKVEEQNAFENQLERDKFKLLQDQNEQVMSQNEWNRLNADRTQAWNERKDFLDRREGQEERAGRARQWQATYDQTAKQNDLANKHWEQNYELENKKLDADTLLQQGRLTIDEWYRRKQLEVQQQELALRRELGYGELNLKRDLGLNGNGTTGGRSQKALSKTEIDRVISNIVSNADTYRSADDFGADINTNQRARLVKLLGIDGYNRLLNAANDLDTSIFGKRFLPVKDKRRKVKTGYINYYLGQLEQL